MVTDEENELAIVWDIKGKEITAWSLGEEVIFGVDSNYLRGD